MSESRFYHISQEGKLSRVATDDAALAAAKNGGFVWLNYCQPAMDELSKLILPLGLHPLSIEDCFDENQIPKIENFPRNTFVLFNTFGYSRKKLKISEIDLFIGGDFLVTVSQRDSENRPVLDGIEHIVEMDAENARHGPSFLMHVILDHVVDQKFLAADFHHHHLHAAHAVGRNRRHVGVVHDDRFASLEDRLPGLPAGDGADRFCQRLHAQAS